MSIGEESILVTMKAMDAARDLDQQEILNLPSAAELEEMVKKICCFQNLAIQCFRAKSEAAGAKVYSKAVYTQIAVISEASHKLGVACGLLLDKSKPTSLAPGVSVTKNGQIKI